MAEAVLTRDHLDRLLAFKGYGNPAGRFWFLGMEEYGAATVDALTRRAKEYREIEDIACVHTNMTKLRPTWATMSKIVLRLNGDPNWSARQAFRAYQRDELGRHGHETFLTEVSPLPARSTAHWPYRQFWPGREQYRRQVFPDRFAMLRGLFEQHRPPFVFCYGKAYWQYLQNGVFHDVRFMPMCSGKLMVGTAGRSTIVLTPFFTYYAMTNDLIEAMARELEANGLPNGVASPLEGR